MQDQDLGIRRLLDLRGIKIGHFCEVVGIRHYQFSRIESGTSTPPVDYFKNTAIFLNMTEEDLMSLLAQHEQAVA